MFRFALSLFLLLVAACAPESVPQGSGLPSTESLNQQQQIRYQQTPKPAYIAWGEVEDHRPRFQMECEDCPSSVGQLITTTVDGDKAKPARITGNCFGTLIGPDQFLTNRHCLPQDLRAANRQCRHRMQVIFPQFRDGQEVEVVGCKKVVEMAAEIPGLDDKAIQPDWAILQLDKKLPQRSIEMAEAPIPDGTALTAFVPLENPETQQIAVKNITCTSRQKTIGVPEYSENISSVILLDCDQDVTKGFSGSPLFLREEGDWKPVAALSHIYDVQINQEQILVSPTVVATSFACMAEKKERPESCLFDPTKKQNLIDALVIEALQKEKDELKNKMQMVIGDESPLQWDDVTVEKIEKEESTPHMQAKWQQILELDKAIIGRDGKIAFFETAAPMAPGCLKPDFVPDPNQGKRVFATMPVVRLRLVYLPSQKIKVRWQVAPLAVEVFADAQQSGVYRLGVQHDTPPAPPQERALLSMGINFAATSFSVCH